MPTPYAPNWSTANVRGTYRLGDNTPDSGSVVFTFMDRITNAADDLIFAAGGSFTANLGAQTGSISVDLPCVDDPDITPNGFSIKVEEKLKSGRGATYYIKPTLAMIPTGLNLRTVLVPSTLSAPEASVRIGVPGGLAVYNSAGNLVDAAGNVVLGGGGGTTSIGLDTDGVPYYSTAGVTGGKALAVDTDGTPYYVP